MAAKPKLNPDQMLQAEYEYIANNIFQANEDRSRFSSYYFVTVGSFAAAILGAQFDSQSKGISLAFFSSFPCVDLYGFIHPRSACQTACCLA
jgi:hypothetical protein